MPLTATLGLLLALRAASAADVRLAMMWHTLDEVKLTEAARIAADDFHRDNPTQPHPVLVFNVERRGQGTAQALEAGLDGICAAMGSQGLGVHAYVGPLTSQEALLVSPILSWHRLPHVSPLAEASELDNTVIYPYFRRTSPNVYSQAVAMTQAVKDLGYLSLGVLYEGGSTYASSMMHAITDKFVEIGGHVMHVESVPPVSSLNLDAIVGRLKTHYVQIVLLVAHHDLMGEVLRRATLPTANNSASFGPGHLWVASEDAEVMMQSATLDTNKKREHLRGLMWVQLRHSNGTQAERLQAGLGGAEPHMSERSVYDAVYSTLVALRDAAAARGLPAGTPLPTYHSTICQSPGAGGPYSAGPEILAALDSLHLPGALKDIKFSDHSLVHYDTMSLNTLADAQSLNFATDKITFPGLAPASPTAADLFRGSVLDVLVVIDAPYITETKAGGLEGLYIDVLEGSAVYQGLEALYSFSVRITRLHGHWSDALRMVGDQSSRFDLLMADTVITSDREKIVDFTQPIFDTHSVLVVRQPVLQPVSMWRFMDPFSGPLWGMIVVIICVGGASFYLLERGHNDVITEDAGHTHAQRAKSFESSVWMTFTGLLMNNDVAPATTSGRVLCAGLFFTSLVLVTTYTAQLTVFLLKHSTVYEVNDVTSFYPSVGNRFMRQVAVANDTVEAKWLCQQCSCCSATEAHQDTGKEQEPLFTADHHTAVEKLLIPCSVTDPNCLLGVVLEYNVARYVTGSHCGLTIHPNGGGAGKVLSLYGIGFAAKKGSPFTNAISEAMLTIKEDGTLSKMKETWVHGHCPAVVVEAAISSIGITDVAGVFVVFAIALGIAILAKIGAVGTSGKVADSSSAGGDNGNTLGVPMDDDDVRRLLSRAQDSLAELTAKLEVKGKPVVEGRDNMIAVSKERCDDS